MSGFFRKLTSGSSVPAIGFCIFTREELNDAYKENRVPKLNPQDSHKKFFFAFNPVSYSENYKHRVHIHPTFGGYSAISDVGVGGNEIKLEIEPHILTNLPVPYVNESSGFGFLDRAMSMAGSFTKRVLSDSFGGVAGNRVSRNGARELYEVLDLLYYCRKPGYTSGRDYSLDVKYVPDLKSGEYINYEDYGYVFYDYDRGRIVEVFIEPSGISLSRSAQDKDTYKISIALTVVREFGKYKVRQKSDVNTMPNPRDIIRNLANGIKDIFRLPGMFAGIVRDLSDGVKQLAASGRELEMAYKDSTKVWSVEMRSIKKDYTSSVKEIKNWGGMNKKDPLNRLIKALSAGGSRLERQASHVLNSFIGSVYDAIPGYIENQLTGSDKLSEYEQSQVTEIYNNPNSSGSSGGSTAPPQGSNNLINSFEYKYPKSTDGVWVFSFGNEVDILPDINEGTFGFSLDSSSTPFPTNGNISLNQNTGKISIRAYQTLPETQYTIKAYYKISAIEYSKTTVVKIKIDIDATAITLVEYKPNDSGKLVIFKNSFSEFSPVINGTAPFNFQLKSIPSPTGEETNKLPEGLYMDSFSGKIYGIFESSYTQEKSVVILVSNSKGRTEHTVTFRDDLILPTKMTFSHYSSIPDPETYELKLKKGDEVRIQINTDANFVGYEVTPSLPEGLALSVKTGLISGVADEEVAKDFIFKISNPKGSLTRIMKIVVTGEQNVVEETPTPEEDTELDDPLVQLEDDLELESYSYARASYFKMKEIIDRNLSESLKALSVFSEKIPLEDDMIVSPIFTDKDRYEIISDFNYLYLLGVTEYSVNFKSQFRIYETDDKFRIYTPTSPESFYDIAVRYYGDSDYANQIASFNGLDVSAKELPSILLLPMEEPFGLGIVNRISEFNPPYSIDRIKNELLGYDLKLNMDKDFEVTANGDLDIIGGVNGVIENLSDLLSVPQGSIISDPTLGNPVSSEGELPTGDMVVDNGINLTASILRDLRIEDAVLTETEQDGDKIIYFYNVKTIVGDSFSLEVI